MVRSCQAHPFQAYPTQSLNFPSKGRVLLSGARKVWRVLGLPYQFLPLSLPFCKLSTHTHFTSLLSQRQRLSSEPTGFVPIFKPKLHLSGDQLKQVHRDVASDQDYRGREGPNWHEVSNGMGVDSLLEGIKQKNGFSPSDNLSVGVLAQWTIPGGGEEIKLAIHSDVEVQGELLSTLSEDEIGDAANSTNAKGRVNPLKGVDGIDGMEFDGGGVASPTN